MAVCSPNQSSENFLDGHLDSGPRTGGNIPQKVVEFGHAAADSCFRTGGDPVPGLVLRGIHSLSREVRLLVDGDGIGTVDGQILQALLRVAAAGGGGADAGHSDGQAQGHELVAQRGRQRRWGCTFFRAGKCGTVDRI